MATTSRHSDHNEFAVTTVERLVRQSTALAENWLVLLGDRLPESPRRIFPDATLLNHVPDLLRRVLRRVVDRSDLPADPLVQKELVLLGHLRRAQGYTSKEIVEEFHLLREVVLTAVEEECDRDTRPVPPRDVLAFARRVRTELDALERGTVEAYASAETGEVDQRTELLSAYGRAITHELRNRLHNAYLALDVYHQLRKIDSTDPSAEDVLERLERSLRHIERVAADVFAAIAIKGPRAAGSRRVPFDDVLRETLEGIGDFAAHRDVTVHVEGNLPTFQVDAAGLQLVLINLVNNAIKYADPNKKERTIRLRCERAEAETEWRIDVIDNGIGIPAESEEHVFARHARLSDNQQGEGLGLTLAREAAAQMGGRLWMTSTPGEGTKFSFTLREPDADLTVNKEPEPSPAVGQG